MMQGSCLCGAVTYVADEPLRAIVACHCTQCRKTSGHFWAATSVPMARFHLGKTDGLCWYRSSPAAMRGFCDQCGTSLFWKPDDEDRMSISGGSLDGLTGLSISSDIFLEHAADYYTTPQPTEILTGSCLCGANCFTLPGPMGEVGACHCTQCRKRSGHFSASFDAPESSLTWSA
ncbi:MAG: GFA family protein, partial [Paracoccaceae bacterium]